MWSNNLYPLRTCAPILWGDGGSSDRVGSNNLYPLRTCAPILWDDGGSSDRVWSNNLYPLRTCAPILWDDGGSSDRVWSNNLYPLRTCAPILWDDKLAGCTLCIVLCYLCGLIIWRGNVLLLLEISHENYNHLLTWSLCLVSSGFNQISVEAQEIRMMNFTFKEYYT